MLLSAEVSRRYFGTQTLEHLCCMKVSPVSSTLWILGGVNFDNYYLLRYFHKMMSFLFEGTVPFICCSQTYTQHIQFLVIICICKERVWKQLIELLISDLFRWHSLHLTGNRGRPRPFTILSHFAKYHGALHCRN